MRAGGSTRWRSAALTCSAVALALALAPPILRLLPEKRACAGCLRTDVTSPPKVATPHDTPGVTSARAAANDSAEAGASTAELLAELGRSRDATEQIRLATALGEAKDEQAFDALTSLSARGASDVANAALHALAEIGGERARQWLEQRFSEAREAEQPQLALALATLGGEAARASLLRAAKASPRSSTRDAARRALATLDSEEVRKWMLSELASAAPATAVAYFNDCAEPLALPALEALARGGEGELREQAVAALVAQGQSAHPALQRLLQGEPDTADAVLSAAKGVLALRPLLRADCIRRLRQGAITHGPVFDYLAEDLGSEALGALVSAAREEGSSEAAFLALAARGDPASRSALLMLSGDANPEVATRALCAQLRDPDSRARPTLLATRGDGTRGEVAAALLSIDAPEATAAVSALARSESPNERRAAAGMLGSFGRIDAERKLAELARDADYAVSVTSLRSLLRLGATSTLRELAAREDLPEGVRERAQALLEHGERRWPRKSANRR